MQGPPTSLVSSASYFNLEGRSFLWGAKWWRTEFWTPVAAWAPHLGYGVRLIWLWVNVGKSFKTTAPEFRSTGLRQTYGQGWGGSSSEVRGGAI